MRQVVACALLMTTVLLAFIASHQGRVESACDSHVVATNESPETVAASFIRFLQQGEDEKAYQLLTETDRSGATLDEFVAAIGNSRCVLGGKIVGAEVLSIALDASLVAVHVAPAAANATLEPRSSVELNLVRAPDGNWQVSGGEKLREWVVRGKQEKIMETLQRLAETWRTRDYAAMASLLSPDYLQETWGEPPYEPKLSEMCTKWESEHGQFIGLSCTWRYVCLTEGGATIPAKFQYTKGQESRVVFYLVSLRFDSATRQWKITRLEQTPSYQKPATPGEPKALEGEGVEVKAPQQ